MVNVIRFLDLSIFLAFTSIVCLSDGKRPDTLLCADSECKGKSCKLIIRHNIICNSMIFRYRNRFNGKNGLEIFSR